MVEIDLSRVGHYLSEPGRAGWRSHLKTEMAIRVHANKSLSYMTRVLIEMKRCMGACGPHWYSLDMKKRQLENYAFRGMVLELKRAPGMLDRRGIREFMVSVIHKLDALGSKAFAKVLHEFQDTSTEILKRELSKLEVLLETNKLSLNFKVAELRLNAHDAMENLSAYLATRDATGGDFSFKTFWQLLSFTYTVIQDLDKAVYMSTNTRIRTLEMFVGVPVCNRVLPETMLTARRMSLPLPRRLSGSSFGPAKTPSPASRMSAQNRRTSLPAHSISPQGHRRVSLPSRSGTSPIYVRR